MTKFTGLFCSTCRKTLPWAKFDANFKFHRERQIWERLWYCRNCGSLCKVETVDANEAGKL